MKIPILYRKELKEYDFGPGHPFRGERYEKFPQALKENLPQNSYQIIQAEYAKEKDLLKICQKEYIDFTRKYFKAANLGKSFNGRVFRFHSGDNIPRAQPGKVEEAARLIIGQAKLACDLVQTDKAQKVVSIGGGLHHAKRNYGEGFCLYNDVAFAATYLIEKYNLERILILDTDVHAGNGTSDYFYSNPKVLLIDLHQHPETLYPGTGFVHQIGEGKGKGYTVNIPMLMFAGNSCYQLVFKEIVEPLVKEFKPQIIIRNGGSDPHFKEILAQLELTLQGFRMIGEEVRKMAQICQGKVIDLIASGYNPEIIHLGWLALISGLADIKIDLKELTLPKLEVEPTEETKVWIKKVQKNLKNYWRCFR